MNFSSNLFLFRSTRFITKSMYISLKSGITYVFFSMSLHAIEGFNKKVSKKESVLQSSNEYMKAVAEYQVPLEGDNNSSNKESSESGASDEAASDFQAFESNKKITENESQVSENQRSEYESEEPSSEDKKILLNPKKGLLKVREHYFTLLWNQGIVPYYIDNESYDDIINSRIHKAMDAIQSASCILFKELDEPKYLASREPWLHITNPQKERDCIHDIQINTSGETVMSLGFDCMRERDIIHALLHALGFKDEVTHPQRDLYVRILWQNIQPQYHYLFRKQYPSSNQETLVEYDTMSIMQFHDRVTYSINGAATLVGLIPGLIINPSNSLSLLDKTKLRLAYDKECNRRKVNNFLETCKTALCENKKMVESDDAEVAESDTDESEEDFVCSDEGESTEEE